jgi:RNA 2',3'-cyclic 3'-phosphodiesterase
MRLFLGLELDDRTRAAVADVAERLRQRLQRAAPGLIARWIDPANLHVTLWFLGEVADDRVPHLSGTLNAPFSTRAFDLSLRGCGAFPPSGPPRVFWIGLGDGADITRLHREVGERLAPVGFEPERRAFAAHLTIARVKDAGRTPSSRIRTALAELSSDCGTLHVSLVTLFRSRLSPRGAAYEPLLRVPLS